MGTNVSL